MNKKVINDNLTEIKELEKDLHKYYHSRDEIKYSQTAVKYAIVLERPERYFNLIQAYTDNKYSHETKKVDVTLKELVDKGFVQSDKNKKSDSVFFNSPNLNFQFEFKQYGDTFQFIKGKTLSKYYEYSEILK